LTTTLLRPDNEDPAKMRILYGADGVKGKLVAMQALGAKWSEPGEAAE
jgi:hypothetical protein